MRPGRAAERVAGLVVLVTGAASGIGRAAAEALAAEGAAVVCADRDAAGAGSVAAAIGSRGSACPLEVTDENAWRAAVAQAVAAHGRLDALVHAAGISFAAPVTETSLDDWRRVLAVNLDGSFLGVKHAVACLRAQGRGGSIVLLSSASGLKASPGASAYCAGKAAVCMLARTAARECVEARDGIRVNTICPAGVRTPMWRGMPFFQEMIDRTGSEDAAFAEMASGALHGRFARADEVAQAVVYLVSNESAYVTGTDLVIDGGYTA